MEGAGGHPDHCMHEGENRVKLSKQAIAWSRCLTSELPIKHLCIVMKTFELHSVHSPLWFRLQSRKTHAKIFSVMFSDSIMILDLGNYFSIAVCFINEYR